MMRKFRIDVSSKTHKPNVEDFLQISLSIYTQKLDFFFAQLQYGLLTFLTQLTQRSQEAFT